MPDACLVKIIEKHQQNYPVTIVVESLHDKGLSAIMTDTIGIITIKKMLLPLATGLLLGECSEFCVTVEILQRDHVIQSPIKING